MNIPEIKGPKAEAHENYHMLLKFFVVVVKMKHFIEKVFDCKTWHFLQNNCLVNGPGGAEDVLQIALLLIN